MVVGIVVREELIRAIWILPRIIAHFIGGHVLIEEYLIGCMLVLHIWRQVGD